MTYSIVARDPDTGAFGVAVQTCNFAVGTAVPAAVPGVGAVATQAIPDGSHRLRALELLAGGRDAVAALTELRSTDDGDAFRQTAIIGSDGIAAVNTGDLCIDFAGHRTGPGYSVQANMMASAEVWPAMAQAYERATGTFASRLMSALRAAEQAGGDARGRMSAAMLIVDGHAAERPGGGVQIDVRVDHDDQPLDELDRLLNSAASFTHYERAVGALFAGDPETAVDESAAAQRLLPADQNVRFVHSGALVMAGRTDEGIAEVRALIEAAPTWSVVIRSFATKGLLAVPPDIDLDEVLAT